MMMMKITDRIFQALCNFSPKTLRDGSMGQHARLQPDHYDDDYENDYDYDDDDDDDDEDGDYPLFGDGQLGNPPHMHFLRCKYKSYQK